MLKVILVVYAGYKFSILEGRKSIDIIQAVLENHFDESHIFGGKQGLNIAVGVMDHSTSLIEHMDPTFASFVFKRVTFELGFGDKDPNSQEIEQEGKWSKRII